ncbi:DUF485 domain-containing protein [Actinokineospora sp. NPDC004072]
MTATAEETTTWEQVQDRPEFAELRRRLRGFAFPMTAAFLLWYLLFVLLADYAPEFMSGRVFGNITVGLLMGLGQFASTFLITFLYVRHADRRLDPLAEKIRTDLESR